MGIGVNSLSLLRTLLGRGHLLLHSYMDVILKTSSSEKCKICCFDQELGAVVGYMKPV